MKKQSPNDYYSSMRLPRCARNDKCLAINQRFLKYNSVLVVSIIIILNSSVVIADNNDSGPWTDNIFASLGVGIGKVEANYSDSTTTEASRKGIFGGRFIKHFGVEFSYYQFGNSTVVLGGEQFSLETEAYSFSGIGYFPINQDSDFFIKGGTFYWKNKATNQVSGTLSVQDDFSFLYGVGFEFRIERFGFLKIEWERLNNVYESDYYDNVSTSIGVYFAND